eukprot:CAMPEP_0114140180 /NCGR_PEP_ID=MMETSP0043_2-20121206/17242_1 /TAXON_ID=464988 /ORGANISM="Hemiselmis andersenii, Strain CCMP644" /LENGTH=385 /DNA_ID=CAMNT_0001234247 /DNA_START=1 /DNA_END=1154 /DNA_ORIENTATION=-
MPGVGDFAFSLFSNKASPHSTKVSFYSAQERYGDRDDGEAVLRRALGGGGGTLAEHHEEGANVAIIQISLPLPLEVDFVFSSFKDSEIPATADANRIIQAAADFHADDALEKVINERRDAFSAKFDGIFGLKDAKCERRNKGNACWDGRITEVGQRVAKAALSEVLGQMSFTYGSWYKGKDPYDDKGVEVGPTGLFASAGHRTGAPSLFEEGFSLMLLRLWDPSIARELLLSWLSKIQPDGWIPPTLSLGTSSHKRVTHRHEKLPQSNHLATPPTILLALESMLEQGAASQSFLRCVTPHLVSWLNHIRRGQKGSVKHSYAWQGRERVRCKGGAHSGKMTVTTNSSGLKDYPRSRGSDFSVDSHVDLMSWVAASLRVLAKLDHSA